MLINQNHFLSFLWFIIFLFLKTKRRFFTCQLFREINSICSGKCRYSVSGRPALTAVLFFRFFLYPSVCSCVHQSVCLWICLRLISIFLKIHNNYWLAQLIHVNLVPGLQSKQWKLHIKNRIQKIEGVSGAIVSGLSTKQHIEQQSVSSCFTEPMCSMVVLWNVYFLSV